jgi:signal transduction histidine kinase
MKILMLPLRLTSLVDPAPDRTRQRREFFVRPVFFFAAVLYFSFYSFGFFIGGYHGVMAPMLVLASLALVLYPTWFLRLFPALLCAMLASLIGGVYLQGIQLAPLSFGFVLLVYLTFDRRCSVVLSVLLIMGLGVAIFVRQHPDEWHFYVGLTTTLVPFWFMIDAMILSDSTPQERVMAGQRVLLILMFSIFVTLLWDVLIGRGFDSHFVQANLVKLVMSFLLLAVSLRYPRVFKTLFVATFFIATSSALLNAHFDARVLILMPLAIVSWFFLSPAPVALLLSAVSVVAIFVIKTPWLVGEGFGYTWRFFFVLTMLTVAAYFISIRLEKGEPEPSSIPGFAGIFDVEAKIFTEQMTRFSRELSALVGLVVAVFLLFLARYYFSLNNGLVPIISFPTLKAAALELAWWPNLDLKVSRLMYFAGLMLLFLLLMMFWVRQQIIYRRLILLKAIEDAAHLKQNAEALAQKAHEASLIKTTFINNVSRDIRTPLNSVFGGIVMLEQRLEIPGASWREPLNIIMKSAGRLLQMVESVLDLTRMFASSDTTNIQPFHLASLKLELWPALLKIAKTRGCLFYPPTIPVTMTPQWLKAASQRGLDLNSNLLPPDLDVIYVDEAKFFKVLERLIIDLLGLSTGGFVQVSYSPEASVTKLYITAPQVVLPEDFIVQLRTTLSHEEMMRGLLSLKQTDQVSLSLCRKLLKEMGGDLVVHSDTTTGAALIMVLPAQMPTEIALKSVE